jgi:hypothetical protein
MSKNIDLTEVLRQSGLDELIGMHHSKVPEFVVASVIGLCDGDIELLHGPFTDKQAELYGERQYGDGKVAKAIINAALKNGMTPGPLYDFQMYAAHTYLEPSGMFSTHKSKSSIRIYPEAVTIDEHPLALARAPSTVMDYSACLTGRSYIADQVAFLARGERPFRYMPITRLPFVNRVLMHTYDSHEEGLTNLAVAHRLYIGREDGVASTTNETIRAQHAHGQPTEIADIILCAETQHTPPEDLRTGMQNTHSLLREGGALIIRSIVGSESNGLSAEDVAGWAFEAGFQEKDAIRYTATGGQIVRGTIEPQEAQTVVLTK